MFEESERRAREQAALNAIATVTSQSLHLHALLQTVLDKVLEVAECEKGFIRLKDPRSGEISLGAHQNISEEYLTALRTGRSGRRSEEVIESGEPIVIDNSEGEGLSQALRDQGIRSVAWIPLKARSTVVGVLNVSTTRARSFAPRDVEFLRAVGKMIGVAIDNAGLFEKVESAYAELQATQQQLVQAETLRALGQMAGGVAHDFNNLLAAILGRAQILHREVNDARAKKSLEVIEQAARDGAETVRRIQEFTRVRQDRPPGPVDVNGAIADALELTRTRWKDEAEERGVRVEVSTSFGTLPSVLGIASELREVLINLILNAIDAMPKGGRLAIGTVSGVERPGVGTECVAIEVSDTGAGIPEDLQHRIFEPFFTTKGPQSSGLGLSVAFGIIARHHGKIEVESEAGQGTTFRILLPVTEIPAREPATPEIGASPRGLLCLVIDDEEHVRDVLADALTGEGHFVKAVATASEGLQALGQCAYDIVFTDLGMPGMTGWEVGQAVKTLRPGTPVVLVTGWSVRLDREERARSGIRAVLAKPFEMAQLFALLRGIIPARAASQEDPDRTLRGPQAV